MSRNTVDLFNDLAIRPVPAGATQRRKWLTVARNRHIQDIIDAISNFQEALQAQVKTANIAPVPKEPRWAFSQRREHDPLLDTAIPVKKALESLVGDRLYFDNWSTQVRVYSRCRLLVDIALWRDETYFTDWKHALEVLGYCRGDFVEVLDTKPKPLLDQTTKYAACLRVIADQLADWSDHVLPELSETDRHLASLRRAIWSVGRIEEYVLWLEFLGHQTLAHRLEERYERLEELAMTIDGWAQEDSDETDESSEEEGENEDDEEEEDEDDDIEQVAFSLAELITSIAVLLGVDKYDNNYYFTRIGICPTRPLADRQLRVREDRSEIEESNDWRKVQERLLRLYEAGEPCIPYRAFAQRFGCSASTVHKAIKNSPRLTGWVARHAKRSPKAQSLNEMVTDKTPSQREANPADYLPDGEVDRIMGVLIEEAQPAERAGLHELDAEGRRELAKAYQDHKQEPDSAPLNLADKSKPIRLRGRKP